MKQVAIVDAGSGNVGAVRNMLERLNYDPEIIKTGEVLDEYHKIILPGVGSFDHGINTLKANGFFNAIIEFAKDKKRSVLGICLGMQMLCNQSEEGRLQGFNLIPGNIRRFDFSSLVSPQKIPHIGWNRIKINKSHELFHNFDHKFRFYFVHSYHALCSDEYVLASCDYGYEFPCVIAKDNVMGVQFHPEKSHKYGMMLLKNFMES